MYIISFSFSTYHMLLLQSLFIKTNETKNDNIYNKNYYDNGNFKIWNYKQNYMFLFNLVVSTIFSGINNIMIILNS